RETPEEDVEGAAADALAKPAHFAFHRAALLMWTAVDVHCVLPAAFPSRSWLTLSGDAPNRPWEATPVFAFELEGLALDRIGENVTVDLTWAYVLLVDPTAASAGAHLVQLESADGRLGEVKRLEPWAENPELWRAWTVDESRESEATPLPRYRLVDSIGTLEEAFPGATRSVGLELFRGGNVVVLLSPVALTVSMG
ncbi:hypothetical protein L6R53_23370, partial [Myxococcota bacterium]|nr:hypothetical protein [Myxococcota bacterium]